MCGLSNCRPLHMVESSKYAQLQQIQTTYFVRLVVIGADGLWVVVDHNGPVAHGAHLPHSAHRTPIKLHLRMFMRTGTQ